MKYNYIIDNWSGDLLHRADEIEMLLSSVYYLNDPSMRVLLFVSGNADNIELTRDRFKQYSKFFQCYYIGNINDEYKVSSYSSHLVYIERYLSLYKATVEYDILDESTTNMVCLVDSTDCYFFKNLFKCKDWDSNISLFADGFSSPYWTSTHDFLEPINSGWREIVDKHLKINKYTFKMSDYVICAGTILCKNLTQWKNLISDLNDFISLLYKIKTNTEMITEQAVINLYYYNKLFKRCVEDDFCLNSGHDSEIVACYVINEDRMYFNKKLNRLRLFSKFQNKNIYPIVHHCHYNRYSERVLNILNSRIEKIHQLSP